jgi:ketosteroid isomerase-like protein
VDDSLLKELVALERSALDRWIALDPKGYLDLCAPEVTYFDPTTERRVDGLQAMQERLMPMKNAKVPFKDPRYEMSGPKVQRHGDVALLTFNLINYGKLADRPESVLARWNSTEVYRRIDRKWMIIHSHWSYIKPELKQPGP